MNFLHALQPLAPVLTAILVALLADIVLRLAGGLRDRVDPLLGIPAGVAACLLRKLNRAERARKVRFNRGIITLVIVILLSLLLGLGLEAVSRHLRGAAPVIWFLLLRVTFPWHAGRELLAAWQAGKKEMVTQGLAILQRRRVPVLVASNKPDRFAIARMFIESAAASLHRGLLSPVLWGLVTALLHGPVMLVAVFVTCMLEAERVVVTQENQASAFAAGFEMVEAVLNFVPARIAALLWVLGALFAPSVNPLAALKTMFLQSAAHRAVNSGWPVAAVAGALHIALPGGRKRDLWISAQGATAKAEARDIQRALWLHVVTLGLVILILSALLLLSLGL